MATFAAIAAQAHFKNRGHVLAAQCAKGPRCPVLAAKARVALSLTCQSLQDLHFLRAGEMANITVENNTQGVGVDERFAIGFATCSQPSIQTTQWFNNATVMARGQGQNAANGQALIHHKSRNESGGQILGDAAVTQLSPCAIRNEDACAERFFGQGLGLGLVLERGPSLALGQLSSSDVARLHPGTHIDSVFVGQQQ